MPFCFLDSGPAGEVGGLIPVRGSRLSVAVGLSYTNLPVSQVAYMLGFNDPAYFSRVFANATGMAPREFRSRIDA